MKIKKTLSPYYHKLVKFSKITKNKLFGHKKYKKFVVISRSRTGSTLLMALLNKHTNIICEGELFKNLDNKSCAEIWHTLYNSKNKKIKQVGFKLFYYHPFDEDKSVWDFIKKDTDISIIHLTRKNLLKSYVSQKIGEKTKQWTENVNRPHNFDVSSKQIVLDFKECLETFETISTFETNARQTFNDREIIEVTYEDLSTDYSQVMSRVLKQLNLPNEELVTVLKKQNPEPLKKLILNYEELKDSFNSTKWKYLFNE